MTRSKSPNYCDTYIIGDGTLVEVDEFKLLGVTFSKDLSFDSHIDAISNKVSKLSRFITRCTRGISSYALLKGCRKGRSDKVSLWYVALLINTRFRFCILE